MKILFWFIIISFISTAKCNEPSITSGDNNFTFRYYNGIKLLASDTGYKILGEMQLVNNTDSSMNIESISWKVDNTPIYSLGKCQRTLKPREGCLLQYEILKPYGLDYSMTCDEVKNKLKEIKNISWHNILCMHNCVFKDRSSGKVNIGYHEIAVKMIFSTELIDSIECED